MERRDKVAIITGVSSGSGRAIAFAGEGAAVAERFGHLDVMVDNAGVEHTMTFLETPVEVREEV